MRWKLKAAVQSGISALPSGPSYAVYYWLQRHFGGLRRLNPERWLLTGISTWDRITQAGQDPRNKVFFEVGTGRAPIIPIAYWLMGATKTVTVDLNPYLKPELIAECLNYISINQAAIRRMFGCRLNASRFTDLLAASAQPHFSARALLDLCGIDYMAPGDAGDVPIASDSVDFHTSYNVFEHIPRGDLERILIEGNRLVGNNGLFVHRIDYGDHFSHKDSTISAINFLQYSDAIWRSYAGNRYMYMNRLRHDDFLRIFESAGHRVIAVNVDVDERAAELLRNRRLRIDERFADKSEETLSITAAWVVTARAR